MWLREAMLSVTCLLSVGGGGVRLPVPNSWSVAAVCVGVPCSPTHHPHNPLLKRPDVQFSSSCDSFVCKLPADESSFLTPFMKCHQSDVATRGAGRADSPPHPTVSGTLLTPQSSVLTEPSVRSPACLWSSAGDGDTQQGD